jgi:hypothetical protein
MNRCVVVAMLARPALTAAPTVALAAGGAGFNPGTVISNVYENPAAGYGYGMSSGFAPPPAPYYGPCRYGPGTRCYPPRHGRIKASE